MAMGGGNVKIFNAIGVSCAQSFAQHSNDMDGGNIGIQLQLELPLARGLILIYN